MSNGAPWKLPARALCADSALTLANMDYNILYVIEEDLRWTRAKVNN